MDVRIVGCRCPEFDGKRLGTLGINMDIRPYSAVKRRRKSSIRSDLRVHVSKIYDPLDRNNYQLYISYDIMNTGKTPALDLTTVARMGWSSEEQLREWHPNPPTSRGVLGPQQKVQQKRTIPVVFSDTHVRSNIDAGTTIWARGVVEYRDVFGQAWRHAFMWHLKDPNCLLNSEDPIEDSPSSYRDYSMTVHYELNTLEKIDRHM